MAVKKERRKRERGAAAGLPGPGGVRAGLGRIDMFEEVSPLSSHPEFSSAREVTWFDIMVFSKAKHPTRSGLGTRPQRRQSLLPSSPAFAICKKSELPPQMNSMTAKT